MIISRRRFLQLVTGSVAGLAYVKAGKGDVPSYQQILDQWADETEEWVPSICEQCPGGCGVLARTVDGRVVKIEGNPLHPINEGTLCMKGNTDLQLLYHPERLKGPLKRVGEKGAGQWEPIEWEEASQMVADGLNKLRAEGKSHTVGILGGQYRGLRHLLWERFAQAYGTPNYIRLNDTNTERLSLTHEMMQGITRPLGYDFFNARLVLSFGCEWIETWNSPVHQFRAYGHLREGAGGQRPKIFHVGSRYSMTAAKADQWIPVNPGKEAVLALGLAHIIIKEGLYDRGFVANHSFGFEDWVDESGVRHLGYKSFILKDYAPLFVSGATGVPLKTLFNLARELAKTKPVLILGEKETSFGMGDLYTRMAIHSLNALTGNIGESGGLSVQGGVPLAEFQPLPADSIAQRALSEPRIDGAGEGAFFLAQDALFNLPRNISKQNPYPLNLLFLYHSNPVYLAPDGDAFAQALTKVPLVVSFSSFMDESTRYADLVLPDQLALERWQDDIVTHLSGFSLFSLGRPAAAPLLNVRNGMEVLFDIAHRLNGGVSSAFPWDKYEDLLRESASGLYGAGRGYVVSSPHEEAFRKVLERQGYRIPEYRNYDDFWEGLLAVGAWWDPSDSYKGVRVLLNGSTRTFDFYSRSLKARIEKQARKIAKGTGISPEEAQISLTKMMNIKADGDRVYLPHDESEGQAESEGDEYPFYLNVYKLNSLTDGKGANQPWLQENMVIHVAANWGTWAEINPHTAGKYGIKDGDMIWLESERGRIKVRAKIYVGAMPQVINVPMGQGHTAYGRWADKRGANPSQILNDALDPFTGLPLAGQTKVRVTKA
jgi:anaerobic selenocysteine-containing dehydrogenase